MIGVLIDEFFAFEDKEGEQVNDEVHFVDPFASLGELRETLHIAGASM